VRTHPESGRDALFVSGTFMIGIDGMTDAESRMLLDFLAAHIQNPNFHVRWSWQPGDLAIWDERRTNHRALSDHYPRDRRMRRCTVEGDRPVLVEA
jgi:taurine dioxygenase